MPSRRPIRSFRLWLAGLIHPAFRKGPDPKLREARTSISSFFVTLLIGLAYQEMFGPVRDSIRTNGLTLDVVCLSLVFFLTSMRFFIGNSLHLNSPALTGSDGRIWLIDFLAITLQASNLAFLGGVCTAKISRVVPIGFVELLLTLLALDILWIAAQDVLGRLTPAMKRNFVPWPWAILNSILALAILAIPLACGAWYSQSGLITLAAINSLAFVIDMILVDHYDLL